MVTREAGQLLTAPERSKKDPTLLYGASAICIPNPSPGLKQVVNVNSSFLAPAVD